jgi:A/G-specific adenine glycosylase
MKTPSTPRALANFQRRLLAWYRHHRRDLPWRASRDPYRIWVAEIMLQQTRIAAVLPYYHRFLEKFPDVRSLARAQQREVLRIWSGLGYYSRARNLHAAAREVVGRHGAEFPRSLKAALDLPGIGRYTAAAILSIAYDAPLAALDGNVARVLARLGSVRGDLREPRRWRRLDESAKKFLDHKAPGNWNEALMELGETICLPRNPRCEVCPAARWCRARTLGLTCEIPAPRRKRSTVNVRVAAAILRDPRGRTLVVREPAAHDGVLFSRLWQFPAVEVARDAESELAAHLRAVLKIDVERSALERLPAARHGVTYRDITLLPFLARVQRLPAAAGLPSRVRILPLGRLHELPVSSATRKIAAAAERVTAP